MWQVFASNIWQTLIYDGEEMVFNSLLTCRESSFEALKSLGYYLLLHYVDDLSRLPSSLIVIHTDWLVWDIMSQRFAAQMLTMHKQGSKLTISTPKWVTIHRQSVLHLLAVIIRLGIFDIQCQSVYITTKASASPDSNIECTSLSLWVSNHLFGA